ncbi:MAG TPA: 7TM diverse intracellular signaling domain-containing protein [Ramlibacter sp.]|uniref:7TM diverse intracellular signaling domain-containing protein n=1 Tax=Ramlibacter sp. TaxID=1917967 RepID=UPI002D80A8C7|nr:7TM diverse intracellular signaling domain-containing protein [Ramlibacter sp.]HET8746799.1 7TM diverse intracellular signaling domain-containing protein [Ramlibacter sp.]
MRWAAARLVAAFLLLAAWALGAVAHEAVPDPRTLVLRDSIGSIDVANLAGAWLDADGTASIEEVARSPGGAPFAPAQPQAIHKLGPRAALWLHLRVQRARDERQDWVIEFPMPALDRVTVYQHEGGAWIAETAGDTLAVARWAERGRYPFFRVDLAPGEVRDLYVRIRHTTAANFPVRLSTGASQSQRLQLEYLALGAAFGALALLIAGCLARGWAYRDAVFGWYAGYAALTTLGVAAYTGTAAHLLWPRFGALEDAPVPMLAFAAVAAAMMFVRTLLALRRRFRLLDRTMGLMALLGVVLIPVPAVLPKSVSLPLLATYVGLAAGSAMLASVRAWMRGDPVARWVLVAYVPMLLALLLGMARVFGWVPVSATTQYAAVVAIALEVPLLLVALFIRSRDRHRAEVREQALSTRDALTGLLAPHLFTDRLRQVVARQRRDGLDAAVMYIELVNHRRIREYFGTAVAEQSLLRSVIKLRRLLRDVDTVSRVGENCFGVLLEGAAARTSVTERASRLIAAGLMPLPGLKPDVTLQFHIAAALLAEAPLDAEELEEALRAQLARMSPRTRRPIRFVAGSPATSDAGDSSLFAPSQIHPEPAPHSAPPQPAG